MGGSASTYNGAVTHFRVGGEVRVLLTPEVVEAMTVLVNELVPEAKSVAHVMATCDTKLAAPPPEDPSNKRVVVSISQVSARLIHCAHLFPDDCTSRMPLGTGAGVPRLCASLCLLTWFVADGGNSSDSTLTVTYGSSVDLRNVFACASTERKEQWIQVPGPTYDRAANSGTLRKEGKVERVPGLQAGAQSGAAARAAFGSPGAGPRRHLMRQIMETTVASARVADVHVEVELIE